MSSSNIQVVAVCTPCEKVCFMLHIHALVGVHVTSSRLQNGRHVPVKTDYATIQFSSKRSSIHTCSFCVVLNGKYFHTAFPEVLYIWILAQLAAKFWVFCLPGEAFRGTSVLFFAVWSFLLLGPLKTSKADW